MTYYIILFPQRQEGDKQMLPGVIKLKVTRANYEIAGQDNNASVICGKGKFLIIDKRSFAIEEESCCFLVCDVYKQY
jgi:hypothetical protein